MRDPIAVGERVDDKYVVESVLGRGGMGVVVAARHLELDQRVAIKVVREGVLDGDEAVERFLREARALARLDSDHVVRVFDVDRLPRGTPYMVMEHLRGSDVASLLKQRGALPADEVVEILLQACAGLAAAHAAGIVHRDLKPGNLFQVERDDGRRVIKLLDFGVATARTAGPRLTSAQTVLGSLRYMAPEQIQSPRDVDQRADIWALGAIGYRLLSGVPPFANDSLEQQLTAILAGQRRPLRELVPDAPEQLTLAIERCLQPERSARPASVRELAQALAELGPRSARELAARIARISGAPPPSSESAGAATVPIAAVPHPPAPGSFPAAPIPEPTVDDPPPRPRDSASARPPPPPPPKRSWRLVAVAVLVAAVGLLVVALSGGLGALTGLTASVEHLDEPLPAGIDPRRVDALDALAAVKLLAHRLHPGAELVGIDVDSGARDGLVDVAGGGSILFTFEYGHRPGSGSKGNIQVEVTGSGLQGTRMPFPHYGEPLADPRCTARAAWQAAARAGIDPQTPAGLHYGERVGAATWIIDVPGRPELRREIDGASCAVVPLKP